MPPGSPKIESAEHRRALLRVARETAEQALGATREPLPAPPKVPGRFGGAFVTFWSGKRLRGCVGTFAPTTDIVETIREVTLSSLEDARFAHDRITAGELPGVTIEISILSDPELTYEPASLIPGVHGIIVRRGAASGCFLPKVASERGWSAEEFLSNCCTMKASLPADVWQREGTEVWLFTADVFSDSEPPPLG